MTQMTGVPDTLLFGDLAPLFVWLGRLFGKPSQKVYMNGALPQTLLHNFQVLLIFKRYGKYEKNK